MSISSRRSPCLSAPNTAEPEGGWWIFEGQGGIDSVWRMEARGVITSGGRQSLLEQWCTGKRYWTGRQRSRKHGRQGAIKRVSMRDAARRKTMLVHRSRLDRRPRPSTKLTQALCRNYSTLSSPPVPSAGQCMSSIGIACLRKCFHLESYLDKLQGCNARSGLWLTEHATGACMLPFPCALAAYAAFDNPAT